MRRSVRTLIFLHAVSMPLIKVLTALENRRDAFFYRHLGPHGPKEGLPLQPESLRRAQTALILFILFILAILLQTRERLRASRTLAAAGFARDRPSPYDKGEGYRRAGAVTSIPMRCRFSCIAYLAPAWKWRGLLAFCCLKQDGQDVQDGQDAGDLCSHRKLVRRVFL